MTSSLPCVITIDSREPNPHPWTRFLPQRWQIERGTLDVGDFVLASHPVGNVVERKTSSDMAACLGSERERFTRELRRGRYAGRMIVVIEGTMADLIAAARGIHINAVVGSIACWTMRYCPFVFAGDQRLAAEFSFRFLASQLGGLWKAQREHLVPTRKPITPAVEQDDEDYRPPF